MHKCAKRVQTDTNGKMDNSHSRKGPKIECRMTNNYTLNEYPPGGVANVAEWH